MGAFWAVIVRYSLQAQTDIANILGGIAKASPAGANKVSEALQLAALLLAEAPEAGLRTQIAGVRVKILSRFPYKLFYRLTEDAVEILHVRHGSRRAWRGRPD